MKNRSYQSQEWFDKVETTEGEWQIFWDEKPTKNGCPAQSKSNPEQLAWLKPRRDEPDVAAKEKMGADLGHLLDLPVSSILLCRVKGPDGKLRPAAISRYSHSKEHLKWSRVKKKGVDTNVIAEVGRYFQQDLYTTAGTWVFDTWIRNRDRSDRNIMVGYSDGKMDDVYFFDFDISMSWRGSLTDGNWVEVLPAPTSEHITNTVKLQHCLPMIEKIEKLPAAEIERIVDRIPDFYLPADHKQLCKKALFHRRQKLRSVFQNLLK